MYVPIPAGEVRHLYAHCSLPDVPSQVMIAQIGLASTPSHRRPPHRPLLAKMVEKLPGWQVLAHRNYRTKRWLDGRVWKVWRSVISDGERTEHVYVRELLAGAPLTVSEFAAFLEKRAK